ncbi:hypothetical protein SSX86_030315 [Deinandra increscens subsp. villosa]|uniref:C2 tensin-type domain-containing protein n=1 Tax=Deinandra increscens subsp. villosa TaxID=3103831 RepID=A0AAP0GK83_9ASTR
MQQKSVLNTDAVGNGTCGVFIDRPRNRVVVAIADVFGNTYSAVAAYDLDSWKRLFFTQLSSSGSLFTTRKHPKTKNPMSEDFWIRTPTKGIVVFALPGEPGLTELTGDFKIQFHDRQGDFYCWLNTTMMENRVIFDGSDFDDFEKVLDFLCLPRGTKIRLLLTLKHLIPHSHGRTSLSNQKNEFRFHVRVGHSVFHVRLVANQQRGRRGIAGGVATAAVDSLEKQGRRRTTLKVDATVATYKGEALIQDLSLYLFSDLVSHSFDSIIFLICFAPALPGCFGGLLRGIDYGDFDCEDAVLGRYVMFDVLEWEFPPIRLKALSLAKLALSAESSEQVSGSLPVGLQATPRSTSGIQALCSLHITLQKAKTLQHCAECIKLHLRLLYNNFFNQTVDGFNPGLAETEGLQWETLLKDLKQPIRVKVGGAECFVESQHVSNCDFVEDGLVAWWKSNSRLIGLM